MNTYVVYGSVEWAMLIAEGCWTTQRIKNGVALMRRLGSK